jgi:hypothetical protein
MTPHHFDIEVTHFDIEQAVRETTAYCVVATAIGRVIPEATFIQVETQTIRFSRSDLGERWVYLTPRAVQEYIVAFDAGDEITPFTVNLRDPAISPVRAKTAKRLTLRGVSKHSSEALQPSKTRCYGQRVLRVNRKLADV